MSTNYEEQERKAMGGSNQIWASAFRHLSKKNNELPGHICTSGSKYLS